MDNIQNTEKIVFFTIKKQLTEISFASREYNFAILTSEQKPGTNGKCQWFYNFPVTNLDFIQPKMVELDWISWNTGSNGQKVWEYLLLKINHTLYSGFINQAKDQSNTFYCSLKPIPMREEEEFNF